MRSKTEKYSENLKVEEPVPDCTTIEECIRAWKNAVYVSGSTSNFPIVVNIMTDIEIDNRPVVKRVDFYKLYFDLFVDGLKVNLKQLSISNSMQYTKHHAIMQIVDTIPVCQGVTSETPIKHMVLRTHAGDTKSYHAKGCSLTRQYLSRSGACKTCINASWNAKRKVHRIKTPRTYVKTVDKVLDAQRDWSDIIDEIFKDGTEELRTFIKAQKKALTKVKQWDSKILSACLNLYVRSPKSYKDLQDSKLFILPSGRTVRKYKNIIKQQPGIVPEMLEWMKQTANNAKLSKCGYEGYLVIDEMKIQEDLVVKKLKNKIELIGFVEHPDPIQRFEAHKRNNTQKPLASNVLQFVFLGQTGFRFPVASFPTTTAKASELYVHVHEAIRLIRYYGFKVTAIMMDGGVQNRDFTNMHFNGHPHDSQWFFTPPYSPFTQIAFVQDISHNIKKIRNSLIKSGTAPWHKKKLKVNGQLVFWNHLLDAVAWDRRVNSRPLSYRLTNSHLNPNVSEKMRNHLAEDMLDGNMLYLLKKYDETLECRTSLTGAIKLLEITSTCISIFRDTKPITDKSDIKLQSAKLCYEFFKTWQDSIEPQSVKLKRVHG